MKSLRGAGMLALGSALILSILGLAFGQQIHRDAFETSEPVWVRGPTDAKVREVVHRITEEHAHGGQRSEFIHIEAETGSFAYYQYDIGQAPIREDLTASIWVRGNRPGVQLLARLVLPKEHHAERSAEAI